MSRDTSGNYTLPEAPFVDGKKALGARVNSNFSDIATALQDSLSRSGKGGMQSDLPMGGHKLTGVSVGVDDTDGPQLGQVGWQRVAVSVFGTTTTGVVFALPTQFDRYRVEWQNAVPSTAAQLYLRLSQDNGATYLSGSADYYADYDGSSAGSAVVGAGTASYFGLDATATGAHSGHVEIDPYNYHLDARGNWGITTFGRLDSVGWCSALTARPTHVLISAVGTTLAGGRFRLLGARFA